MRDLDIWTWLSCLGVIALFAIGFYAQIVGAA